VTAASNSVINAATTSAAETAADDISDAEEDARKIAEEEERMHENDVKKNEEEVEAEEKKKNAEEEKVEEAGIKASVDNTGIQSSTDASFAPALPTVKSKMQPKPKSAPKKLKPKPVVTPEMRDLLIVKGPIATKVQAAEKVSQKTAADSSTAVDEEVLRRTNKERGREDDELNAMRVEDKESLIKERFRREKSDQKKREESLFEEQISNKSDLEMREKLDERNYAAQLEKVEHERIRIEEEYRLLEEKDNLLRLQEEEREQEHRLIDDVAEQYCQQEEREKRDEEIRNQSLQEKEMLEAQLEMEDDEAANGLIGEIEGGEDELVENNGGVNEGEGVASTGTIRRGVSFQDLT